MTASHEGRERGREREHEAAQRNEHPAAAAHHLQPTQDDLERCEQKPQPGPPAPVRRAPPQRQRQLLGLVGAEPQPRTQAVDEPQRPPIHARERNREVVGGDPAAPRDGQRDEDRHAHQQEGREHRQRRQQPQRTRPRRRRCDPGMPTTRSVRQRSTPAGTSGRSCGARRPHHAGG
jgi:hypothetical protein